jgi:AraC-like DNA-binding protein
MMLDERGPDDAIGLASRRMIALRGRARIGDLVARSGLSTSQFLRRFATQVGMTPKLFARTIRFDRALVGRRDAPSRPWTDIIHELGYFDQAISSANAMLSPGCRQAASLATGTTFFSSG